MIALRSGRRLNSHSAASSTQRKPFQMPGRRRDVGVAREQQREYDGECDERQALVRHEDDRADEQQREARADLRHVGGAGDQGKDDKDCAEHGKPLDSRWRNYSRFRIAARAGGAWVGDLYRVTITACRMQSCSPRWPASTRISGRVIRRSCSSGSRAVSPARDAVWDCGCGSGQASVALAEHFRGGSCHRRGARTDSRRQDSCRACGTPSRLPSTAVSPGSVDLVTVAQALHWFDLTAFYAEAARVARPGALLAVLELSTTAIRGRRARPAFLRVSIRRWLGRIGRRSAGTSRTATRRCRFPSRKSRRRNSASSSTGTSIRSRAT